MGKLIKKNLGMKKNITSRQEQTFYYSLQALRKY